MGSALMGLSSRGKSVQRGLFRSLQAPESHSSTSLPIFGLQEHHSGSLKLVTPAAFTGRATGGFTNQRWISALTETPPHSLPSSGSPSHLEHTGSWDHRVLFTLLV